MTTLDIRQLSEHGGVNPIAPVTVPEAVKFEDGADLTTAIGSIATIETSPAMATHAVGDYIEWNGKLYSVTAAIAVGETLTVNTNIEAKSVGEELTALNNSLMWKRLVNSSITGNGNYTANYNFSDISEVTAFFIVGSRVRYNLTVPKELIVAYSNHVFPDATIGTTGRNYLDVEFSGTTVTVSSFTNPSNGSWILMCK